MLNLLSHYLAENGSLKDVQTAFDKINPALGNTTGHAYTIKDVGKDSNEEYYLSIINPWDYADCLKLTFDNLFNTSKFYFFHFYGYSSS